MSVHIVVNGKYTKNCRKHHLLTDPERVKKDVENERRKMRIQQVRAASKNIAKQVRNDVEIEKERQLRKIEEIKEKEMEQWRQNTLGEQERHFRSAIFEVGTAHRAARADNNARTEVRANQTPRKRLKHPSKFTSKSKQGKENVLRDANAQTDITGKCYPKPSSVYGQKVALEAHGRTSSETSSTDEFLEECEEETLTDVSSELSSDVDASTSLSDSSGLNKKLRRPANAAKKMTKSSPAIEARGKSSMTNKHGSKSRSEPGQVAFSTKDKLGVSKRPDNQSTVEIVPEIPSTSAAARKRFTQISDIIRQQTQSDHSPQKNTVAQSQRPVSPFRREKTPTKSPKSPSSKPCSKSTIAQKSPGKSKSPSSRQPSRPTSGQTTVTFATKSTSSLQSQRTNPKVQFFDYNNKFEKQYEAPDNAVEEIEAIASGSQMNAMEQAELNERGREAREAEMEKLRQKCAERCQKAIEKEQVRRACEDLTAKLDAITKQRPALPSDTHQFSSHHLERVAAQKETKLNNAVEEILIRPAVITCPLVKKQQDKPTHFSANVLAPSRNDLNLGPELSPKEVNSLNSSDSCCSILLGYVNGQTKQIVDDIQKYSKQNGETDRAKAEKLQDLLTRINRLRECLLSELKKCSESAPADKDRVQNMMDSISEFRREREEIVVDDKPSSISKRETDLKKKEACLEKKLREFYEMQKAGKCNQINNDIESSDGVGKSKHSVPNDKNVGITKEQKRSPGIIGTEKNKQAQTHKTDTKELTPVVKASKKGTSGEPLAKSKEEPKTKKKNVAEPCESDEESDEEIVGCRKLLVGENPVEIIIKLKNETKQKKTRKSAPKSPRRLSSLIQIPVVKKTRIKSATVQSSESGSTSYRSLPPTIQNNVDKLLQSSLAPEKRTTDGNRQQHVEPANNRREKNPGSHLNPLMAHYVQRLLGMSRTSINALGVSSSEIETPSSSIVNTTANLSAAEIEQSVSNRLEQVQKFINDNYSFVGELEDSLRQSSSSDSSRKAAEIIWKKLLSERKNVKKSPEPTSKRESPKPSHKPALKKPTKKRKQENEEIEIAHVDKSSQLTDNCTQRISELTAMINKVRQEKQKILETTLSSVSENGRNSTEYLELPDQRSNSAESTSRIIDSQLVKSAENLPGHSPETVPQLEKNKPTGMSRDSGISLSRPITVQETRESPTEELPPRQSSTESLSAKLKTPRPPISIARYSPQLVEDVPHELSTIFEVDTPATSRVNTSVHANNGSNAVTLPPVQDERADKIEYRKFPTFEEYAELHQLDMSQFDPEFTTQIEKEFNEFFNLVKEGKVSDYEHVMSFSKYFDQSADSNPKKGAEEFLANLKLVNLSFKKFPTRKEYLHTMGVATSDLLDSQTLENVTAESSNLNSNSSSTESIMNIEKELKLRNILTKSFKQNLPPENDVFRSNTSSVSPKDKYINDESGVRQLSTAVSSTEGQSDDLENQLKSIGINWPSAMKRKTMETQALSSSTSSSLEAAPFSQNRKGTKISQTVETSYQKETHVRFDSTSQTEGGRRLNLQEFITKELLKRTTTSSSFSFSDDSVASSILRSIIGSMTPNSQQPTNGGRPSLDRHKTSTPMASRSASSGKGGHEGVSSVQFFSGESRLSSVLFNNSSKSANKTTAKSAGAESSKDLNL